MNTAIKMKHEDETTRKTLAAEPGRHCGATALSCSMHTHPVAVNVFKHRRGDEQAG